MKALQNAAALWSARIFVATIIWGLWYFGMPLTFGEGTWTRPHWVTIVSAYSIFRLVHYYAKNDDEGLG